MELRLLKYFVTVASEGSFSRAADVLNMAQPPLSRQIQQLEEGLGVRLLNRSRPVTLTEAGRYLFEQACQMLSRADEIRRMTRTIAEGAISRFAIGFVASTFYGQLPDLIRRFRLAAPGVDVALIELTTLEQTAALKDGRIDIGFGRLRFDDEQLVREILHEEPVAVAVPSGHRLLQAGAALKLRGAVGEPLIVYPKSPRPSYADQVLSFYRDQGLEPKVDFEVRELQTALGLVAAGVGICLVPASVKKFGRDDIAFIDLDEPTISTPIVMSCRRNDQSPLLAQCIDLVRQWPGPVDPEGGRVARGR